jgi:hypothetical protein
MDIKDSHQQRVSRYVPCTIPTRAKISIASISRQILTLTMSALLTENAAAVETRTAKTAIFMVIVCKNLRIKKIWQVQLRFNMRMLTFEDRGSAAPHHIICA